MIADIILDCTSIGDWVYDPFLGVAPLAKTANKPAGDV